MNTHDIDEDGNETEEDTSRGSEAEFGVTKSGRFMKNDTWEPSSSRYLMAVTRRPQRNREERGGSGRTKRNTNNKPRKTKIINWGKTKGKTNGMISGRQRG